MGSLFKLLTNIRRISSKNIRVFVIVHKQTIQKMNLILATTLVLCIASMAVHTNAGYYDAKEPDPSCSHCYDHSEQTAVGCRKAHPTGDNTCVNLQGNSMCSANSDKNGRFKKCSVR